MEIYALMYQQRKELWRRQEITLWLLASDFAEEMSLPDGAHLENEYQVGKGVLGGTLDGFPIYLLGLNEIPLNDDTLPLFTSFTNDFVLWALVSKGLSAVGTGRQARAGVGGIYD